MTRQPYRLPRTREAGLICASFPALAEDAISHPARKPIGPSSNEMVASLAVINSDGASLEGNKLTLKGVSTNSIVFADRPIRAAGHVLTSDFIREWDEGARELRQGSAERHHLGAEQGRQNGGGRRRDTQVAEARGRRADLRCLGARGRPLERDRPCLAVHRSVRRGCGGFHGGGVVVGGRPAWHGAWYARPGAAFATGAAVGAAVGAAAATPGYYAAPACGYYPYPPCYPGY